MADDQSLTLVTGFFDIGRENWGRDGNPSHARFSRSTEKYMINGIRTLSLNNPMLIFIDEKYIDFVTTHRKGKESKTIIVTTNLEDFPFYNSKKRISDIMTSAEFLAKTRNNTAPEYTVPEYDIIMFSKFCMIHHLAETNPFKTTHIAWIDFGIHPTILKDSMLNKYLFQGIKLEDKITMGYLISPDEKDLDIRSYYGSHTPKLCGTMMIGSVEYMKKLLPLVNEDVDEMLRVNRVDSDQALMTVIFLKNKHLFAIYKSGCFDNLLLAYPLGIDGKPITHEELKTPIIAELKAPIIAESKAPIVDIPIHIRNPDVQPEVFDHASFIADMCKWWKPNVYLEYGLSTCLTTSRVSPYAKKIIGVDVNHHPNMDKIKNLSFYKMKTSEFKPILDSMNTVIDVAFIDACHESRIAFQDFKEIFPHVIEDGLIFLHDTYPCYPVYVEERFCHDCWKLPHLIKKEFGDRCEIITIPVQPGLTMVKKKEKYLPWSDPKNIDYNLYRIPPPAVSPTRIESKKQNVFPISFCIPESQICADIPIKTKGFSTLIPGDMSTYIYNTEEEYYNQYKESFFGLTMKKGGWDCMRHYEILACGCIPWFKNLDECPPTIMTTFPKMLIQEAMSLPGVSEGKINWDLFQGSIKQYYIILKKLLQWTRENLTTKHTAKYMIDKVKSREYDSKTPMKILFLSGDVTPDYQRCLLLHGLKSLENVQTTDYPKIEHLYDTFDTKKITSGKGFSYAMKLKDIDIDRKEATIHTNIADKYYDLVVYGSVHRGVPLLAEVAKHYPEDKIVLVCGEDDHVCKFKGYTGNIFIREL